jgi:hypothetical protein
MMIYRLVQWPVYLPGACESTDSLVSSIFSVACSASGMMACKAPTTAPEAAPVSTLLATLFTCLVILEVPDFFADFLLLLEPFLEAADFFALFLLAPALRAALVDFFEPFPAAPFLLPPPRLLLAREDADFRADFLVDFLAAADPLLPLREPPRFLLDFLAGMLSLSFICVRLRCSHPTKSRARLSLNKFVRRRMRQG